MNPFTRHKVGSQGSLQARYVDIYAPRPDMPSALTRAIVFLQDGENLELHRLWEELSDCVIVAIHSTSQRSAEYAHACDEEVNAPLGALYARYVNTIAPMIGARYPGVPWVAAGASMGGLAAMQICMGRPNSWTGCVAMSPSLGWAHKHTPLVELWIRAVGDQVRLYLDTGGDPYRCNDNRWAVDAATTVLSAARLTRWTAVYDPTHEGGDPHTWDVWSGRVSNAVDEVLKP